MSIEQGTSVIQWLKMFYQEDLADMGGLSVVPIHRTMRRIYPLLEPEELKGLLVALRDLGKVELVPHSRTQPMGEIEERSVIPGEHGESYFYWKPLAGFEEPPRVEEPGR